MATTYLLSMTQIQRVFGSNYKLRKEQVNQLAVMYGQISYLITNTSLGNILTKPFLSLALLILVGSIDEVSTGSDVLIQYRGGLVKVRKILNQFRKHEIQLPPPCSHFPSSSSTCHRTSSERE